MELAKLIEKSSKDKVVVTIEGRQYEIKQVERVCVKNIDDDRKSGWRVEITPDIPDFQDVLQKAKNKNTKEAMEELLIEKSVSNRLCRGAELINSLSYTAEWVSEKLGKDESIAEDLKKISLRLTELHWAMEGEAEKLSEELGIDAPDFRD